MTLDFTCINLLPMSILSTLTDVYQAFIRRSSSSLITLNPIRHFRWICTEPLRDAQRFSIEFREHSEIHFPFSSLENITTIFLVMMPTLLICH